MWTHVDARKSGIASGQFDHFDMPMQIKGDKVAGRSCRFIKDGTLWYYRTATDALRAAGITPLIEELNRVVSELEHLAALASVDLKG